MKPSESPPTGSIPTLDVACGGSEAAARRPEIPRLPARSPRWRLLAGLALGVGIFLFGFVAGGATALIATRAILRNQAAMTPRESAERITRRLGRGLDLSPDQQRAIEAVLNERLEAILRIRREARPRVEEELNRIRADIEALLDARQAAQWRKRMDRLERFLPPLPQAERDNNESAPPASRPSPK